MTIAPRRPIEDTVTPVEVTLTLRTSVPVLGSSPEVDVDNVAALIVDNEIETFCTDFGWEVVAVVLTPGAPAAVLP